MKLKEAQNLLCENVSCFCRIHRCSIINLDHVTSYNEKEVNLDNGKILPISKSFLAQFRTDIFEYVKYHAR